MKAQITIIWYGSDTKVTYSEGWREIHNIEAADCLKDAIYELEQEYNAVLKDGL